MAIIRSTNPLEWVQVDRVSIAEVSPPGAITDTGVQWAAFVVGKFERGPTDVVTYVSSAQHFADLFGGRGAATGTFDGFEAVAGKKWADPLYVIRVSNSTMATSAVTLQDNAATPADSVVCTASSEGAWGDRVRVQAYAPSDTSLTNGFAIKVTLLETDLTTVEAEEYLDNIVDIDNLPADGTSKYVNFSKAVAATLPPDPADGQQSLTGGSEGSFADADYVGAVGDERGLYLLRARTELGIVVAGPVTAAVNAGVAATVAAAPNMVGVIAGASDLAVSAALTDVANYRNTDGRLIYAFPYVKRYVNSVLTTQAGHADIGAALTRLASHRDLAGGSNATLFAEISGISKALTESDYEQLNAVGICSFEQSDFFGIKIRNGVNTSMDTAKLMIFRRRMTDQLTKSIANRLEHWLGRINSTKNRLAIKGEIERYLEQKVRLEEIEDFLVDVESLNSASSLANGELHIKLQIKLFSSLRFIVLHAEVGERVEVAEV